MYSSQFVFSDLSFHKAAHNMTMVALSYASFHVFVIPWSAFLPFLNRDVISSAYENEMHRF